MKNKSSEFNFPFVPLFGANHRVLRVIGREFKVEKSFRKRYQLSRLIAYVLGPFRFTEHWLTKTLVTNFSSEADPVFIIGHWRSGTTLLHNLLSQDPRFGYCSTYQSLLPGLTLINQFWLSPIIKKLMPTHRPADHVALNLAFPQEEEFALGNLVPWCFYYAWYFPQDFSLILENHIKQSITNKRISLWMKEYRRFIQQALINTKGRIYLSKNPPNTLRIPLLLEMFPTARFIFIIRNPYEVYESSLRFAKGVLPTTQLQHTTEDCLHNSVLLLTKKFFERYEATRQQIPSGNLCELTYESLITDPLTSLKAIYAQFHLPGFEELVDSFKSVAENPSVKSSTYTYTPVTIRSVNSIWNPTFERFGYHQFAT